MIVGAAAFLGCYLARCHTNHESSRAHARNDRNPAKVKRSNGAKAPDCATENVATIARTKAARPIYPSHFETTEPFEQEVARTRLTIVE